MRYSITDSLGRLVTRSRTVRVVDTIAPVLECPDDLKLVNWNNDAGVVISDAVAVFTWLFLGGPAHYLGEECQSIAGCSDS